MTTMSLVRSDMSDSKETLGNLFFGSESVVTLELPWKNNEPLVSCIPCDEYRVVLAWSNRFAKVMPRLLDVPGRSGILIHPLNTVDQTQGCIGVGKSLGDDGSIVRSKAAFARVYQWLAVALRSADVWIEVTSDGPH